MGGAEVIENVMAAVELWNLRDVRDAATTSQKLEKNVRLPQGRACRQRQPATGNGGNLTANMSHACRQNCNRVPASIG